ncbi:non-ribosomal peptide synthetase [Paenibacillus sp. SYP-B4298]|uniref:non-ribosomal peptide synthetase n=1 Tax=Paenibacillus sp. SYP-B4298 TaxID=2996034 RepID=UPI0022DD3F76|nr:non-ribosomal peptide synthetase [Paenibacillus sp. SYP-B4298]
MNQLEAKAWNRMKWKSEVDLLGEPSILRLYSAASQDKQWKHESIDSWLTEDKAQLHEACEWGGVNDDSLLCGAWSALLSRYLRMEQTAFAVIRSAEHTVPFIIHTDANAPIHTHMLQAHAELADRERSALSLKETTELCGLGGEMPSLNTGLLLGKGVPAEELKHRYDLIIQYDDGKLEVLYAPAFFAQPFIRRLAGHLRHVIMAWLHTPQLPLGHVELLTAEERELLASWNSTDMAYPSDTTVHALFEEQVARAPHLTAAVCRGERLTYQELNERAECLAWQLRRRGAEPGQIVGIMASPSLEMLTGVLAILKTGAAYLPIDPAYPADRIAYMLQDSGTRLCVIEPRVPRDGLSGFDGEILCAAEAVQAGAATQGAVTWENEARQGADDLLDRQAQPDDLAYVIYTSGSTGRPKGVMVEHRSLINLCTWHQREFEVSDQDRAIKYAGFGFDASVWEIFPYLLVGAAIHLLPEELRLDAGELQRYCVEQDITIGFLPTQFCEQFMERELPSLRVMLTGGDKLKTFRKQTYTLYNCYGPTENTVVTTAYPVTALSSNIPIGYPVHNSRLHIVDAFGQLQPIGIPGELCISGDGLARGYLNQPEMTAEKFAPSPLAAGGRMYRTGDLARWTEQGTVEFLGRIDHQVKIRGFRIEIGEIEHRLLQHEAVLETIVIDREDALGAKYLCGYYVADRELAASELAAFAAEQLPNYMIPAKLLQLEALPLTANGKVDRRALPLPSPAGERELETKEEPQGELEVMVATRWQEVLGAGGIGACESFFELGGDSLKAAMLQTKLERSLAMRVPVSMLYECITVREQAEWLCAELLRQQAVSGGAQVEATTAMMEPIARAPVSEVYPVAPAQRRLYFIEQMEQVGTAYNAPFVFRIDGEVSHERLEQSLRALIARHDALRTSLHWERDEIVQRVHTDVPFELLQMDVSEQELDASLRACIQPFDLSSAPLLRAWLFRLSPERRVLLIDVHHIIVDGISANLLFEELSSLYNGESLPELRIGFSDYAVWCNREERQPYRPNAAEYWARTLSGELPILQFPSSKDRPAKLSYEGDTISLQLPMDTVMQLKRFAAERGATLYMVLFAAYQTLLFRYTNQEDIITGVPVAGRMHEDALRLVGMLVNTLPVRCYPERGKTFAGFLNEVRSALLDTFEHQDYELEELVRSLNAKRDPSRNLLFDTLFVMQNTGQLELKLAGAKTAVHRYVHPIAKYDLLVDVNEEADGLRIDLQYSTALFDREEMEAFGDRYVRLLADALNHPDRLLSELALLSTEDTHQIVYGLNATAAAYPQELTIHQLFERQAERTPDKTALVFGCRSLTYRQLNERANQLAHTLRRRGVGRDEIVGLMVERSLEMIVGLLAILKAGGAYVPIDPEYPQERVAYMLENSRTRLLLTQEALAGKLSFGGEILLIDQEEAYSKQNANLLHVNEPHDLLYVIYTSGTTGKPKGVMIEHRNIVNLLFYVYQDTNVDYSGHVLQFTTISFDVCSQEIWSTLAAGGTLHLITNELRMNVGELLTVIEERQIEILFMPVSFLKFILNEKAYADRFPSSVKHVITAGEQLIVPEKFREHLRRHGVYLHNHYGPSETHVVTAYTIDPAGDIPELPPIGRPIANTQIYIVNERMQPQPVMAAGELYIAGHNVGRGYYNNEEMTAERYVTNPFVSGGIMYKTGDLARWTNEGTIEFLGRLDHQVKIRGFRIELGEVENCLLNHPSVTETIVIAKDDGKGGKYLCAYVVASGELPVSELRAHVGTSLPDYMIPSHFVQLPKMPLTPNGKTDRKALPEPAASHARREVLIPPSTETEHAIAQVWCEVLQLSEVGIHDNFFELGGHSLKAISVAGRLQQQYEIRMNDLFEYQTIAELAARLQPKSGHMQAVLEQVKQSQERLKHANHAQERAAYEQAGKRYEGLDGMRTMGYGDVLLTGATGYLGIHLLYEAMETKAWTVHAIVRGSSGEQATARLRSKCAFYFGEGWFERHKSRIHVYAGDITQERLGLTSAQYAVLQQEADAILHAAANVKHYGNYAEFELQNVTATARLLEFALAGKRKDMHHMSTLGVATGVVPGRSQVCYSEDDLDIGQQFENYYAKTKFEAERLVVAARERGLRASIYRLGNIVFQSETGRFQENIGDNAFYTLIKSFLELGKAPMDGLEIDFTYVDALSKAVLMLADCQELVNETFHLVNPNVASIGQVIAANPLGKKVALLSFDAFIDELAVSHEDAGDTAAVENIMLHYGWMEETAFATQFEIFSSRTDHILGRIGFHWPLLSQQEIDKMFYHCKKVHFISP